MQFRRQSNVEEGINLTPLIDVVFLLLIFFMVSTTFTKETHLKIALPEAQGELQPDSAEQIEVVISADGSFSVNGRSLINKQVETLVAAIDKVGSEDKSLPFVITADAKVPYEYVVTVMDAAGRSGYFNISMTTRNPQPD